MTNTEYLCKAKRTDNDEWVTGCLLVFDDEYRIATSCLQSTLEDEPDAVLEVCTYKVDPSTICRCVGIEDKTGNLVWENDIIEKEFYTDYNAYANSEKYAGVVRWSSLRAWEIETERGSRFLANELEFTDFKNHCKVVGNVFDNPELLEEIGIKKEPDMEDMEL